MPGGKKESALDHSVGGQQIHGVAVMIGGTGGEAHVGLFTEDVESAVQKSLIPLLVFLDVIPLLGGISHLPVARTIPVPIRYAFIFILLSSLPANLWAAESYKLSMLPRYSSEEINRRISPLAGYLTRKTGDRIEAVITSDFTQYEKQLKSGAIGMGYENPYICTLVSGTHEALAMAVKGKDRDKFRGIIIARKGSGLTRLEDLRGKLISIVGYTSAGGYLSQKLSLMEAGIDVNREGTISEAVDNWTPSPNG